MKCNYFPGEEITLPTHDADKAILLNEDQINEKYIKGEVRIVTEQARYPLPQVSAMVKDPNYQLNPEFQRRHRWNVERKSKLIESFIINVPIPPIFLYEVEYSEYEVMDGLQRLTAISQFYDNKFKLQGLKEWPELNGLSYDELPEQVRKGIDRRYISSIILLQETAKSPQEAERLKQMVFERINSGGEKLTSQEVRNALYPGKFNELCIKLARDKHFCKMWQIPEQSEEELKDSSNISDDLIQNPLFSDMSDVEAVLRFFAYRQLDNWTATTLEVFLDEYLKQGNTDYNQDLRNNLESLFLSTTEFAFTLLGEKAFCLYRKRNDAVIHYDRPTKLLYDPLMFVLSNLLDKREILISKREDILHDLPTLHLDNQELFEGRRTNKKYVIMRFELFEKFFNKYI